MQLCWSVALRSGSRSGVRAKRRQALRILPDGAIVATTYAKYTDGPELNSVVGVRFKLSETDALPATRSGKKK
ncbi:MAG: hypothetical protein LBM04_07200 [Opitutaceae bacterium]|nr:hypothetical protein [Opitutaceae bacterium]